MHTYMMPTHVTCLQAGSQGFDMTVYQTNRAANAASVAERRAAAAAAAGPFAVLTPQQAAAAGVSLPYAAPDFHLRSPPKQLPEKVCSHTARQGRAGSSYVA